MPSKKLIVVFGATGAQGGGLVRAILADPSGEFSVRAVTRNAQSDKAKELARLGAEIVVADIDEPTTVDKAVSGAYGAYFVTFYWAHFSPEKELAQATTYAAAAKSAGIKHVIWSTLEDTRELVPLDDDRMPTLMGKYKVPHFDAKGESDKIFLVSGVPVTFLRAAFYWENFIYFGSGPKRGQDGKLALTLPIGKAKMAGVASEDIGKCAFGIFRKGAEMVGQTVGIAGEHLTGQEMADGLSKALKQEVRYNEIPASAYRALGFPGADDLGNMFQIYDEFADDLNDTRDIEYARELNPQLQTFAQWLGEHAMQIPID